MKEKRDFLRPLQIECTVGITQKVKSKLTEFFIHQFKFVIFWSDRLKMCRLNLLLDLQITATSR